MVLDRPGLGSIKRLGGDQGLGQTDPDRHVATSEAACAAVHLAPPGLIPLEPLTGLTPIAFIAPPDGGCHGYVWAAWSGAKR
ncbi:hypothetical protein GCM10008955_12370 [Deinococcus malanensis]|uniref:Uncharacterized protein n=1 Tax=Deinococcus malanensis TaxID=1706855 RepID=A0ABQ2ESZ6_9DEIO|nr:hypothetical protein GCM10008955_12370 [Deinococcus malanensis]